MFTSHYFIAVAFITTMLVSNLYIFSAFDPTLFVNISSSSFLMDRFFNVSMGCFIVMVFTILIPDKKV
ncbi:hypothetical protein CDV26_03385 [Francisella halioticida]|uniref:Uncharacterized protein n=1 Tax=Francisella halioticida TaxID=549298 RepID=A0ABN5AUD8_9GAMM|nr:hypothetical protein [Francisella halioticida]ASG67564.1 hypothetical protein CDV26_03385 [Francisella halioticida]